MNNGEKDSTGYSVNLIGAGGIASWVLHGLVRPARRFAQANDARVTIRVYDSDSVDDDNVHHQNFRPSDVGKAKVDALCDELADFQCDELQLFPCEWDVRDASDIDEADLTVVAVDSPDARELVISSAKAGKWAICTCAGDSFMFLTVESSKQAISMVTENAPKGASCQLSGAISEGKIEAGNMAVAAVAQTWVLRSLREMSGEEGAKVPVSRAESTVMGTLGTMSESEGVGI
tara:strand:- start:26 stop:724 length:699 start_codon:yes stop_codon:yes gene_type:complete